ncbi:hypothetical protein GALMADRAFT_240195 [Galerina marginata CBS 339.88]|uniref:F-box domain-containing protein n=1 Tax=Galerina marginata (strain CBS 339.88) TaxID=685588 RepID=A0A067TSH4_GALM3|nr:hypothetical protein GALMADRAFT_240195 [Galerina marginata CBS 339.88]
MSTTRLDLFEDEDKRPTKRPCTATTKQQTAPKKIRGRRGFLKGLLDMPLDILFETFGRLEPLDLLRVSRTSKTLRKILMSRTSITIWRQSLSFMGGLPACFPGMNEPQYSYLMFDETCYFCGTRNAKQVIMLARLRCCRKCGLTKFKRLRGPLHIKSEILDITPYTCQLSSSQYAGDQIKYYVEEMEKLYTEYTSFKEPALQKSWLSHKRKEFKVMKKAFPACYKYLEGHEGKHIEELELMRSKRAAAIIAKLQSLGWEDELGKMDIGELHEHPAVKHGKELTERGWKAIESRMILFMENSRRERLTWQEILPNTK